MGFTGHMGGARRSAQRQKAGPCEHSCASQLGDQVLQVDFTDRDTEAVQSDDCLALPQAAKAVAGGQRSRCDVVMSGNCSSTQLAEQQQERKSPSFLLYKWPKGSRGWSIIALLLGVSGPSLAVLAMLVKGRFSNSPEWYFTDESGSCTGLCFWRYQQMLYMLCCLSFLTSYYAATVGFLGSGPVTWAYNVLCLKPHNAPVALTPTWPAVS